MHTLRQPTRLLLITVASVAILSDLQAQLRTSKTTVGFGTVPVTSPRVDSFYVKNDSSVAFNVTSVTNSIARFVVSVKSGTVARTINGGDSVWYFVTFTPDTLRPYSDIITINHDAPRNNPLRVGATGQGIEQLFSSKANIAFGTIVVTKNKVDSFYIKNRSAFAYNISSVIRNTAAYTISAKSGVLTGAVNPGDSAWYYVTFTPSAAASYPDTVKISHNALGVNPIRVPLSGTGDVQLISTKTSFAFGTVGVGISKTDSFYIKNRGVVAYSITATSTNLSQFVLSRPEGLITAINAGDSARYIISFTPDTTKSYADTIKLTHGALNSPFRIPLTGQGDVALLSSKATIAFGNVAVQATKTDSFYIKNKTASAHNITAVTNNVTARYVVTAKSGSPTQAIAANDSAWYYVAFTPDTLKSYPDTVKFTHDTYGPNPIRIPLSGQGDVQLASSKASIAFGVVAANTPKVDSFYVKNRSASSYAISAVATNTTQHVVTAKSGNLTPTLAGGDSAWYYVTFTPDTIKSFPDTVKISHNALGTTPLKVPLSGQGDAQFVATKSPLAFGSIAVQSSKSDSFYVKNRSNQNLTVSSITSTLTNFVLTAAAGAVNAGDSLKVKVTFTPDAVATFNDTVVVSHNASFGNPMKVPMSGTGTNLLRLTNKTGATLTTLAMVDTFANALRKDSVYVKNTGGSAFTVSSVTFSNPEFQLLSSLGSIPAGDSLKVVVGYVGSSRGRDSDTLKVFHDFSVPGSSPLTLPVTARALASFALSTTSVGAILDTHVVRISATNTGTTPGTVLPSLAVDSTRNLTVFMRNIGPITFRVDSIKFQTPHFYSVMPVPFSIRPGDNSVYQVLLQFRFQPKAVSTSLKDTVTFFTNDTIPGGDKFGLAVEGSSRNVAYILTQRNRQDLNFGSVSVYGSSADSSVRVHNYKTTGTTIDSVRLAQKNAYFKVDTVSSFKKTLAQGDTSLILVRFAPTDTLPTLGATVRDTLLIYNIGSGLASPYKIPMAGVPTMSVAQVPNVTSINFGESTVGIFKDSVIKVYNRTRTNYRIDSLSLYSGVDFSIQSNVLATQMNAGDSTAIQVRFEPMAGVSLRDTLYIWHTFPTSFYVNPRKIALLGSGSTQQLISADNYSTVDNVQGFEGVAISSLDSTYSEKGNFWNNTGGSIGPGHRRSPNLSGSNVGSEATWTFKIDSTGPYMLYHFLLNSPNVGGGFYVHFRKFGVGGIYDSVRYNGFENRTFTPGVGGTWKPLMMHHIDGVGFGAASVSMGADERSGGFLRVDAIRLLRSQQRRDIEFGRRTIAFASGRVPEEFPEVTLGDSVSRPYRLYNLGYDTLTISDIRFFKTTPSQAAAPRFFVRNFTGSAIKVPPMTVNAQNQEVGGYFDLELVFAPFEEEIVRDSMVVISNDDNEPSAFIILNGQGINYYFTMNASVGNTEPHFRAPAPGQGGVTTIPRYFETANGSWLNTTLAAVTYPIPGGNLFSRVNTGGATSLPHQAFYEFELPDLAFGRIPTDGAYILEYGGPAGTAGRSAKSQVVVSQSFGVLPDTGYYSSQTPGNHIWSQIGGSLKTFLLFPGGKITAEFARTAQTNNEAPGLLQIDLLRVRKVPTGALIGVSRVAPDSLHFGEVNFRDPGGIDGQRNKQVLGIGSRGEKALTITQMRLRDGRNFQIVNPPAFPYQMPAINGNFNLSLGFTPPRIASSYRDTLEIYSNSSRQDTLLLVPLSGAGVGGTFVFNDDGTVPTEVFMDPARSGLYIGTWDNMKLNNWQTHATSTVDSIGLGNTRTLLPIPFNNNGYFEWYPLVPTITGESDSIYANVVVTVNPGAARVSPAARYRVFQTGGATFDTTVNQNSRPVGRSGMAEINLGNHYFLRGGRDAQGGAAVFGHVRVTNDTAAVGQFYRNTGSENVAVRDTFALVADALILRELLDPLSGPTDVETSEELPRVYTLSQNYPNPFNPTTTINFTIPERVGVSLKIYDILGREVATLLHGDEMNPGSYSVRWHGRTDYNIPASTGVYFYRIVAGGFVQVKKMVLVK